VTQSSRLDRASGTTFIFVDLRNRFFKYPFEMPATRTKRGAGG
jgi:hypothetical protein